MRNPLVARLKHETGFREPPINLVVRPFQEFFRVEATSGIVLLVAAITALVLANSPWSASYFGLWETEAGLHIGPFALSKDLLHWINDGLMAVFFFVVGLEIKRELLVGELSTPRRAALPFAAALGGMAVPALIYASLNAGGPAMSGWAIPMATDIAFALGILALAGSSVPIGLKVFLAALAIVDDLGAVLVIAVFYTDAVDTTWLLVAGGVFAAMLAANRLGVRHPLPYGILGGCLWLAVLQSGVHATVAGVLAAMTIPARARIDTSQFVAWGRSVLNQFQHAAAANGGDLEGAVTTAEQRSLLQALEEAIHHAETPLQRLEHALSAPNAYIIVPLFALANAGVANLGQYVSELRDPVAVGIALGLLFGKPIGIVLFSYAAVRTGIARLPAGVRWRDVLGAGMLAGIGFTMSLFIADLAFGGTPTLSVAKVGILTASVISGTLGFAVLRRSNRASSGGSTAVPARVP